jgi:hypothetical protein
MTKENNTVANIQENVPTQENVADATPNFVVDTEYTFSMRSFRIKNGFTFAAVTFNDSKFEILIGSNTDYKFGDLLQAKAMQANLYATFKTMVNINGKEYPRFWDIGIG